LSASSPGIPGIIPTAPGIGQNVGSRNALSNISEMTPFKISGVVIPESIGCPWRKSSFYGINLLILSLSSKCVPSKRNSLFELSMTLQP